MSIRRAIDQCKPSTRYLARLIAGLWLPSGMVWAQIDPNYWSVARETDQLPSYAQSAPVHAPPLSGAVGQKGWSSRLPDLGSTASQLGQSRRRGEAILREVRQGVPLLDDPLIQQYVEQIVQRLNAQTGMDALTGVVIVRDPSINAFATPGGVVAVNTGMLLAARREDHVAGVISHELAHVSQHHAEQREIAMKHSRWLGWGGMLAGALVASRDPEAGGALMIGSQAATINRLLSYSRDQEREADRIGLQYLIGAGYRAQAVPEFFGILQDRMRMVGFAPAFLLTHPLTHERLTDIQQRALSQEGGEPPAFDARDETFHLAQARIQALTQDQALRTQGFTTSDPVANHYNQALRALREQRYADAERELGQLQTLRPNHRWIYLLAVELAIAKEQWAQANKALSALEALYPNDYELARWRATLYEKQGQPTRAIQTLTPWTSRRPSDVTLWLQLTEAMRQQIGQKTSNSTPTAQQVQLLRYRAETQWWGGDTDEAIASLERASRLTPSRTSDYSAIQSRLEQMREQKKIKA